MTVAVVHTFGSPCRCHLSVIRALEAAGLPHREVNADALPESSANLEGCRIAFDQTDTYRGDGNRHIVTRALVDAGLDVIGSPPEIARELDDKLLAREAFKRVGLPVAATSGWPRIVKSARTHGSRAVRLVRTPEEETRAREEIPPPVVVEEFVAGREVAVCILGRRNPRVLPPVEIRIAGDLYTQEEKWGNVNPAVVRTELPSGVPERLLEGFTKLGLRDFARFDLRVRPDAAWVVLEVNVRPSLEPEGLFAIAASLEGLSAADLILQLLRGIRPAAGL